MTARYFSVSIFLLALFIPSLSLAANRTFCFNNVVIEDARVNCPTSLQAGANKHICTGGIPTDVAPTGHLFELWDKDIADADDFIGLFIWSPTVTNACVTFAWEGSTAQTTDNETHPDPYMVLAGAVRHTSGAGHTFVVADATGVQSKVTFRSVANTDCTTAGGAACTETSTLRPTGAETIARYQGLTTGQIVAQEMNDVLTHDVVIKGPMDVCMGCGAGAVNRQLIQSTLGAFKDGEGIAHEFGHVLQMQMFSQDYLVFDYSFVSGWEPLGTPWWMCGNCTEWQSSATVEGFASYFSQAMWRNPGNASAVPVYLGANLETATLEASNCDIAAWTPLAVAKGFWDLDDINNEAAAAPIEALFPDGSNRTTKNIVLGWMEFPDGTGNGEDEESDQNGVNAKDYMTNGPTDLVGYHTMIQHNCLTAQDSN